MLFNFVSSIMILLFILFIQGVYGTHFTLRRSNYHQNYHRRQQVLPQLDVRRYLLPDLSVLTIPDETILLQEPPLSFRRRGNRSAKLSIPVRGNRKTQNNDMLPPEPTTVHKNDKNRDLVNIVLKGKLKCLTTNYDDIVPSEIDSDCFVELRSAVCGAGKNAKGTKKIKLIDGVNGMMKNTKKGTVLGVTPELINRDACSTPDGRPTGLENIKSQPLEGKAISTVLYKQKCSNYFDVANFLNKNDVSIRCKNSVKKMCETCQPDLIKEYFKHRSPKSRDVRKKIIIPA